ncbi:hypothetical protein FKP32DRAFT_1675998 [Trametes sanguinea]|nr:hypothetical protein FKP32DRAFT_1675998 [Trametes sanguinea]
MSSLAIEFADSGDARYTSSSVTRARRKSKRKLKGGKKGHPGIFSPSRLALFEEYQAEFNAIPKTARTPQNVFWRKLFREYWPRFPWTLPLKSEPDDGAADPPPDDDLTKEELAKKGKAIKNVTAAVKRHFRYVRDRLQDRNPWDEILSDLGSKGLPPPASPRQLAPWQLYMTKKHEEIPAILEARKAQENTPPSRVLALRSEIARERLALETDEYRKALQDECVEMLQVEEAELEAVQAHAAVSPDSITLEKLTTVVQPLLEKLREHTGFYFTLLAGMPHANGTQLKVISAGKSAGPVPVPWHLHDTDRFKREVMGSFISFLAHTPEGLNRPIGTPGSSTSELPASRAQTPSLPPLPSSALLAKSSKTLKAQASRGKGKQKASSISEDEMSAVSSSDSSGTDTDTGTDQESDDEASGDEEEEDDVDMEKPDDVDDGDDGEPPTADELGVNDAIKRQLALMSPGTRNAELRRLAEFSEFDLETLGNRVRAAEILAGISGGPNIIPLSFSASEAVSAFARSKEAASHKGKGKAHKSTSSRGGPAPQTSRRQSQRLAGRGPPKPRPITAIRDDPLVLDASLEAAPSPPSSLPAGEAPTSPSSSIPAPVATPALAPGTSPLRNVLFPNGSRSPSPSSPPPTSLEQLPVSSSTTPPPASPSPPSPSLPAPSSPLVLLSRLPSPLPAAPQLSPPEATSLPMPSRSSVTPPSSPPPPPPIILQASGRGTDVALLIHPCTCGYPGSGPRNLTTPQRALPEWLPLSFAFFTSPHVAGAAACLLKYYASASFTVTAVTASASFTVTAVAIPARSIVASCFAISPAIPAACCTPTLTA